jgi:hypothetical protein
VTDDIGRMLKKHLPELVERYTKVPASQRASSASMAAL